MVITVLVDKYKVGSERGIKDIVCTGILQKLNTIIEWDWCTFPYREVKDENDPEKTKKEEIRDYLGENPELKPGDMFFVNGNVIAVDSPDRLILIISETGPLAIDRIYDEMISVEIDYFFNYSEVNEVSLDPVQSETIPDTYQKYTIPYKNYVIWCDKYKFGRENVDCLKATIDSDIYLFPMTMYIKDSSVWYDPMMLEEEDVPYAVRQMLANVYCMNDRKAIKKEKEEN